ncbi:hypothetical protein BGW80DRAFT_360731 [Lactifluus volemus]|nr:hypothetical protein BGW80DRAFT_360731 [Lactifluus volemus]
MFGLHECGCRYLACVEGPHLPPPTFEEVSEVGKLSDSGPRNAVPRSRSERWAVSNRHARPLCSPGPVLLRSG